ncbi:MAG: siphovirus ReqiPepy6 Gp37-like family protein [Defluviitaleaceae bacterium]|nr:siphovirus ReqiPepy6 Gp37-like family protein [Defluviitaleaceae bacterium]
MLRRYAPRKDGADYTPEVNDISILRVFNAEMLPIAELDNISELWLTRRFFEPGEWAATMPFFDGAMDILAQGKYFLVDGDPAKACLLEKIEVADSDSPTIGLSGGTLSSVLKQRIVLPNNDDNFFRVDGQPAETIMHRFVASQCISPQDPRRAFPELEAAHDHRRGVTANWRATFSDYLHETLTDIAIFAGLGYNIRLDIHRKRWMFEVLEGRDLSATQRDNANVIFGARLDNLGAVTYEEDLREHRTSVYTISGNIDENDFMLFVSRDAASSGIGLRETFFNASSFAENHADLRMVGDAHLRDLGIFPTVAGRVIDTESFKYGVDWELGDIVTVIHSKAGKKIHQRVTEVTELSTPRGNSLEVRFGTDRKDPVRKIESIERKVR